MKTRVLHNLCTIFTFLITLHQCNGRTDFAILWVCTTPLGIQHEWPYLSPQHFLTAIPGQALESMCLPVYQGKYHYHFLLADLWSIFNFWKVFFMLTSYWFSMSSVLEQNVRNKMGRIWIQDEVVSSIFYMFVLYMSTTSMNCHYWSSKSISQDCQNLIDHHQVDRWLQLISINNLWMELTTNKAYMVVKCLLITSMYEYNYLGYTLNHILISFVDF